MKPLRRHRRYYRQAAAVARSEKVAPEAQHRPFAADFAAFIARRRLADLPPKPLSTPKLSLV